MQWRNEIETHTTGFTVSSRFSPEYRYSHGGASIRLSYGMAILVKRVSDISKNDIVLTTVSSFNLT